MVKVGVKRTDAKRQDIVQAGIEEFLENGFERARTTSIAHRANVSSRTLYKHFESKRVLFSEIIAITIRQTSELPLAPFDVSRPVQGQILKVLEDFLDYMTSDRMLGLARLAYTEFLRDEDIAREAHACITDYGSPIRSIIIQAIDAGALRPCDTTVAVEQLLAMVKGIFFEPVLLTGEAKEFGRSRGEILADCVEMFVKFYAVQNTSAPEMAQ